MFLLQSRVFHTKLQKLLAGYAHGNTGMLVVHVDLKVNSIWIFER